MKIKNILLSLLLTGYVHAAVVPTTVKLQADIITTMLYLPGILSLTSEDEDTVKIACAVDALAHAVKASSLYNEGIEDEDEDEKYSIWYKVKTGAHVMFAVNAINDMNNIDDKLSACKRFKARVKAHKTNMLLQLSLEALLRGGALYFQDEKSNTHCKQLREIADIVGIFRSVNQFYGSPITRTEVPEEPVMVENQGETEPDLVENAAIVPDAAPAVPKVTVSPSKLRAEGEERSRVEVPKIQEPKIVVSEIVIPKPVKETLQRIVTAPTQAEVQEPIRHKSVAETMRERWELAQKKSLGK